MSAKPAHDPIFELSDQLVDAYAKLSPVQASMAGVPGAFDDWDDYSPEGGQTTRAALADFRRKLEALPAATDRRGVLARRVMADFLDERIGYFDNSDNLLDLNNIESPMQHMRVVFDVMDTTSEGGWESVATRLETIAKPLARYRASLEEGARRGLVPAKRQVEAALAQAKANASEATSFAALVSAYDAAGAKDAALRARLERAIPGVRAAYADFCDFLQSFHAKATARDAVGRERYARAAKRFLGAELDLEETYAWGFEEVRKIEAAMGELAGRIQPGRSAREVIEALQQSPDQVITDPARFLDLMRERQERALSELLGTHFDVPEPIRRLDIKLAPEGGALGAYYIPPSDGFRRPGTVFYAPGEAKRFTLFSEITVAYHEGFPGHHLQCGLQVYFADKLSRLHRLYMVCSGYAEGWALYAEELMDELGYFDKPEYVLGMHMAKLFRAYRVAADIGMHLELPIPKSFDYAAGETWRFEHCVELMSKRAFINRDFAESEATRYMGWPGQAISYKVGERVILDLRREMREKLGGAFDLRKFHDAVLGTGSVGLDLLKEWVREELVPQA
jgi:uncharacterized protein (DUF885 family)